MKVAIIGSREGFFEPMVHKIINTHIDSNDIIVSGGAKGVDTFAENFADMFYFTKVIIRPEDPTIKYSYIKRNHKIVRYADKILIFWNGKSKGTKSVIDYAKKIGKEMEIILQEQPKHLYTD